jgi:uncharacterized protein
VTALEIVLLLVILVGLVGTVVPYFPGVLVILAAAVVWAGFGDVGGAACAVVLVMAVIGIGGMILETIIPLRTTAGGGAPRWVFAVGAAGVLVGFFVIPVVGALIGGPLAILLAEFYRLRDPEQAWRSTKAALRGIGIGILVEFLAAFLMIVIWVSAVLLT